MLFILTGNIQIGKSRWLTDLVNDLESKDIPCYGVIAPGIWVESNGEHANEQGYEKLGIDNILLPGKEKIRFADRIDIAKSTGSYDGESQAGKVGLGWHIKDEAIERVNEHFKDIASLHNSEDCSNAGLLVVDELGRLELENDAGLTEAIALLNEGPTRQLKCALVVARVDFAKRVESLFTSKWGGSKRISPTEKDKVAVEKALTD